MQIGKPDPADTANSVGSAKGGIPFLLIFSGIAVVLLWAVNSCVNELQTGGPLSEREKYFQESVLRASASSIETISIRLLTNFQWDRVCYAIPYERQGDVEKKSKASFPDFHNKVPWADHEGFWTLLFTGSFEGFVAIRVPRVTIADHPYADDESRICVSAKKGVFKVVPVTSCAGCSTRRFLLSEE